MKLSPGATRALLKELEIICNRPNNKKLVAKVWKVLGHIFKR
jgi:hypothetical protein